MKDRTNIPAPTQGTSASPAGPRATAADPVDTGTDRGRRSTASKGTVDSEVTAPRLRGTPSVTKGRSGPLTPTNAALGAEVSAADENPAREASEPSKRQTRTTLPVYEDFDGVRHQTLTPVKAIRAKCVDCCCHQWAEVRRCPCPECALWPYRFGRRPKPEDLILPEVP